VEPQKNSACAEEGGGAKFCVVKYCNLYFKRHHLTAMLDLPLELYWNRFEVEPKNIIGVYSFPVLYPPLKGRDEVLLIVV